MSFYLLKSVLKNIAKFTDKHLCQCVFFNTVAGRGDSLLILTNNYFTSAIQMCSIEKTGA